jgi:glycosyltransferase involved in cell wall biosynthesis
MVIIPDRLSALLDKGEVTERYYNPGDLFERVDIVLVNDDHPDPGAIQPMVGSAELHIHNLPATSGLFKKSLLWRPRLLRRWAATAVELAHDLRPQLIRCHGAHLNSFAASEINRRLGIPYVVSMHINPDADIRALARREDGATWRDRLPYWASIGIERASLRRATAVVCVYRFIAPYAERMGAKRIEVIYNVVCPTGDRPKTDYSLNGRARVVVPGRQVPPKDATPLLEAVVDLPQVDLTLIGNGALHGVLQERAERLGIADRCQFIAAVPNDSLCMNLRDYDVLVSVNDYGGVSKVELESSLVGMPIITNRHPAEDEPEVLGQNCLTVEGDAASYRAALERLLGDEALRERLGSGLRDAAHAVRPERMEQAYVDLYRELALPS